MMTEVCEISKKLENMDRQIVKNIKEQDMDLESVRQQLMGAIQQKADFRDIDNMGQKLHSKIDQDKVQLIIADFRQEMVNSINQSKKDNQTNIKKKDEGIKMLKTEIEAATVKTNKDFISL